MVAALQKRYGRPSMTADGYIVWKLRGGGVVLKREKFQDVVTVVSTPEMTQLTGPYSNRVINAAKGL